MSELDQAKLNQAYCARTEAILPATTTTEEVTTTTTTTEETTTTTEEPTTTTEEPTTTTEEPTTTTEELTSTTKKPPKLEAGETIKLTEEEDCVLIKSPDYPGIHL